MQQYLTADYIIPALAFLITLFVFKFIASEISKCRKALSPEEFREELKRHHAVSVIPTSEALERGVERHQQIRSFMAGQVELEASGQDRGQMIYHLGGALLFLFLSWLFINCEAPLISSVVASIFHIDTSKFATGSTQDFVRQNSWGLIATVILGPVLLADIFGFTHLAPWFTKGSKQRRSFVAFISICSCAISFSGLMILYSIQHAETYHIAYGAAAATNADMSSSKNQVVDLESQMALLSQEDPQYIPSEKKLNLGIQLTKAGLHIALALAVCGAVTSYRWILLGLTTVFAWFPSVILVIIGTKHLAILNQRANSALAKLNRQISQGQKTLSLIGIKSEKVVGQVNDKAPSNNPDAIPQDIVETSTSDAAEEQSDPSLDDSKVAEKDNNNFNNQPSASGFNPFDAIAGDK